MFNFFNKKDKYERKVPINFLFDAIKTVIGHEDFFKGDIVSNNFLRIDGDFLGNITSTKRVIIGEEARVKASINSNELVISGIVFGNIDVKNKIKVFSSGCIIGNISCKSIEVDQGAIIDGYMKVGTKSLSMHEKDMFIYTGFYKVDEDILSGTIHEVVSDKKDSKKTEISNQGKYLYDLYRQNK